MIIKNVPLSQLSSHPLNNKIYEGNMDIDDLADNISKVGLLEPLVVIPSGKGKSYYSSQFFDISSINTKAA